MKFTLEQARNILVAADVFYGPDEECPEDAQTLNMNDTWGWATGFGEYVPNDKLQEVADLFWRYGYHGLLYWVSERHEHMRSEFEDINRFVDFVRQEEKLLTAEPNSTKRAYTKVEYTLGTKP